MPQKYPSKLEAKPVFESYQRLPSRHYFRVTWARLSFGAAQAVKVIEAMTRSFDASRYRDWPPQQTAANSVTGTTTSPKVIIPLQIE